MSDQDQNSHLSRRDLLKWLSAVAVTPLLAACGVKEKKTYLIKISLEQSTIQFNPAVLSVPVGASVIWQNTGIYPQTVTCDPAKAPKDLPLAQLPDGAKPWDSGVLYPGQTWSYTFHIPGSYLYFSQYSTASVPSGVVEVG